MKFLSYISGVFLSGSVFAASVFTLNGTYNSTSGLADLVAWGTADISAGGNETYSTGPSETLGTPYKWLYSVDVDGVQTVSLAAPKLNTTSPNSTALLQSSTNFSSALHQACMFEIPLPLYSVQDGQQDNGTCASLLPSICIADLLKSVYHNGDSFLYEDLESRCQAVQSEMRNTMESSACQPYFTTSEIYKGSPLPMAIYDQSMNSTLFNQSTQVLPDLDIAPLWSGEETFGSVLSDGAVVNATQYTSGYRSVKALVLAFVPPNSTTYVSYLNCVRVTNHTSTAYVPPVLQPTGTSFASETHEDPRIQDLLTVDGSLVGGITAGTTFAIIAVIASVWAIRWYHKKRRNERLRMLDLEQQLAATLKNQSTDFEEASEDGHKAMLDGQTINEMDGASKEPAELASRSRSEMEGSSGYKELEDSARKELGGVDFDGDDEADERGTRGRDSGTVLVSPLASHAGSDVQSAVSPEEPDCWELPAELPGHSMDDDTKSI